MDEKLRLEKRLMDTAKKERRAIAARFADELPQRNSLLFAPNHCLAYLGSKAAENLAAWGVEWLVARGRGVRRCRGRGKGRKGFGKDLKAEATHIQVVTCVARMLDNCIKEVK